MGIHSIEQGQRIEDEVRAREELIKQFNDWAVDETEGTLLPPGWHMLYRTKELREAWELDKAARREFMLEMYQTLGKSAPYAWVRESVQKTRNPYKDD